VRLQQGREDIVGNDARLCRLALGIGIPVQKIPVISIFASASPGLDAPLEVDSERKKPGGHDGKPGLDAPLGVDSEVTVTIIACSGQSKAEEAAMT